MALLRQYGPQFRVTGETLHLAEGVVGVSTGTLAARPAAAAASVGQLYYATDADVAYQVVLAGGAYAWRAVAYDRRVPTDASDLIVTMFDDAPGSTAPANTGATAGSWTATNAPVLFGRRGPLGGAAYVKGYHTGTGIAYLRGFPGVEPATLTISLWLELHWPDFNGRIIHKLYSGATWSDPFFAVGLSQTNTMDSTFAAYTATGGVGTVGGTAAPPERLNFGWHHVGLTYDGTTLRQYLDGAEVASVARAAINYNTGGGANRDWVVGNVGIAPADEHLNAVVQDLRIASVARSAAWFREVYQRGLGYWQG